MLATLSGPAPTQRAVYNAATLEEDILLAFREKPYWREDALIKAVKQPERYVKDILRAGKLCQKVTQGEFRYHWELTPTYRVAGGAPVAAAAAAAPPPPK